MKKIVIFYEELVSTGGAERVAIDEAKYFEAACETQLLTFRVSSRVLSYARGKPPSILAVGGEVERESTNEDYGRRDLSAIRSLRRAIYLRRTLKRLRPSVVLGCAWGGWIELFLATLFTDTPYVLHVHGTTFLFNEGLGSTIKYSILHRSVFDELRGVTPGHKEFIPVKRAGIISRPALELLSLLDYLAVRRAREVIVVSERGRHEVARLYNRKALKLPITAMPSVPPVPKVDVKRMLDIEGKRMILSVCRLERIKRVDVVVGAFHLLAGAFPDAYLVIVGTGPEERRLRGLAEELGISSKVKFVGFVEDDLLPDYYAASDVFAYAGWSDLVLTIYEALAAEKPVVCSSEIESDEWMRSTGLVTQTEPDVESFFEGLKTALSERREGASKLKRPTLEDYLESMLQVCLRNSR